MSTHYVVVKMGLPGPRGHQGVAGPAGGFNAANEARMIAAENRIKQLEDDLQALQQTVQGLVNHNIARGEIVIALDTDGVPFFNPTVVS